MFTHAPGDTNTFASPGPGWVTSATFGGGTWNLSYATNSQNLQITTTVTNPPRYDSASNSNISDNTVFVSVPFPTPPNPSALQSVRYYAGPSTLLKTINVTYDGNGNYLPMNITATLNDTGQTSSVSYQYFNLMRDYPTQKQESDFTGTVRTTKTTYNGFMKPTSVNIYNGTGAGSPIASTLYTYDEYSANYCKNGVPMLSSVTGATGHNDAFGTGAVGRGNVTTIQRLISGTIYATTHMCYDTLGNVTQTVDANGNPTSFAYSENWADTACIPTGTNTHAFPTTVTDALGHQTKTSYYTCTNLKHSVQDPNDLAANRSGTVFTYDEFNRPLTTTYPDTGSTTMGYPTPNLITITRAMGSGSMQTAAVLDGYGRTIQTQLNSDPDCSSGDKTDTTYDPFSRIQSVSNPYCTTSDLTYGITSYAHDAFGRTTRVTNPDNSTLLTTYVGPATQVQDEGNGNGTQRVTRISQTDGLGRLTSVCEVAPGPFVGPGGASSSSLIGSGGTPASCGLAIAGTGFLTTYQYDALDNLLQVNQSGVGSRAFAYDSLSRLTSSTNPESGTVSYTYDANGNVATKVAPAANQTGAATVTTTYSYDTLNRLLTKSYSDGTTISPNFYYDVPPSWAGPRQNAIGRMTVFYTVACLGTTLDYDPLGRITGRSTNFPQGQGCGGGSPRNYTYDLAGNLTSETDGAYNTRNYIYNSAGRLTSVTANARSGWNIPPTLISGMHYNALGDVTSATLQTMGSTATESRTFTNRGWLQSSSTIYNANSPIYSLSLTHAPNGNVTAANDSANGNWTYGYDAFNRLVCANLSNGTCAAPTNGQPTYNYVYDRFGNRWQQNGPHSMQLTFSGSNNRMDGFSYDAAGNVLNDGTHSYTYDAENRIVKVDAGATATYIYDAEGHSAQKTISASNNQYETPGTWDFLYDLNGRLQAEETSAMTFWRGEVYAGNRHVATIWEGDTYFDEQDQVGSDRARFTVTHDTFQLYNSTSTNLPFGDWLTWPSTNQSPINFTGQRRDPESGLDDFGARYFGSPLGRFMSPDEPLVAQDESAPQSWNLYSYVANNPINAVDPDGHDCVFITDNAAQLTRGDCQNVPNNATNVTYVPGTIDPTSGHYSPVTGTLTVNYTPYGGDAPTIKAIGGVFPTSRVSDLDRLNAVARGAQLANGIVTPLGNAFVMGASFVPPLAPLMIASQCVAEDCGVAGIALAALPLGGLGKGVLKILGGLLPLADETVANAIRVRGGGAAQVNKVASWLAQKTVAEVAKLAAQGNEEARTAIKIIKQAARLAQK